MPRFKVPTRQHCGHRRENAGPRAEEGEARWGRVLRRGGASRGGEGELAACLAACQTATGALLPAQRPPPCALSNKHHHHNYCRAPTAVVPAGLNRAVFADRGSRGDDRTGAVRWMPPISFGAVGTPPISTGVLWGNFAVMLIGEACLSDALVTYLAQNGWIRGVKADLPVGTSKVRGV